MEAKRISFSFSPVPRSTVHEDVYGQIRAALVIGKMAPGQRIVIRELATALGTSMMPIREALRRLEAENALVSSGNGTLAVPLLVPEDYKELCLIRVALESKAASEAAGRITKSEVAELQATLIALDKASSERDLAMSLRLNYEFHHIVYVAAKLPLLLRLIESLWLRVGPQLAPIVQSDIYSGMATALDHPHRQVLAAMKRRDGRAAAAAIALDIRRAEKLIVAHLSAEAGEVLSPPEAAMGKRRRHQAAGVEKNEKPGLVRRKI